MNDRPLICIHPGTTDRSYSVVELAVQAEHRGLHGVYLSEHTHIPVTTDRTLYPGANNRELPERYARLLDPFVSLAAISQVTSALELGTSVCLPCQHDAIALAKTTATLDFLSGGRLVLGVGFGWNREEIRNHGIDPSERANVLEETVDVLKALWTEEVATYAGEHIQLTPSSSWPKPVQHPHPRLLLGARGKERNFRRISAWADGWLTMENPIMQPKFASQVARLREIWTEAGRDGAPEVMAQVDPGTQDDMSRMVDRAIELDVGRLNFVLADHPSDVVLPILDDLANVARS